ncbi:MAG: hypothetical protein JNK87_41760 [Bryobacterales bacterium]|nr:hypothetical protein [Bryobacterales bacterium]
MKRETWPLTLALAGDYLHQDWQRESSTLEEVLGRYANTVSPRQLHGTVAEIDRMLNSDMSGDQLRQLWFDLDCQYDLPQGEQMREWLHHVREELNMLQKRSKRAI